MAIQQTNRIKTGINVTELILQPSANESFLVKDIFVSGTDSGYATIYVGDATRGYFRTSSTTLGNHLPFIPTGSKMKTILGELWDRKIFLGYPLGTGTKLLVKNTDAANISILYDKYDKDDIKDTMPNGEESKEFTYLAYGQPSTDINTAGTFLINKINNPAELPLFPFAETAPAGESIVHGVCFSSRGADNGTAANYVHTKYLKIMKGERHLFDEDKNGFLSLGKTVATNGAFEAENGFDIGGEGTDLYQKTPFFFTQPIVLKEKESLDTHWTTEVHTTPGTFLAKELEISYIITKKGK